jgi:hypothetical protein
MGMYVGMGSGGRGRMGGMGTAVKLIDKAEIRERLLI